MSELEQENGAPSTPPQSDSGSWRRQPSDPPSRRLLPLIAIGYGAFILKKKKIFTTESRTPNHGAENLQ